MEKKRIKRKEISDWLKCHRFYPDRGTLSEHVDRFYGSRKYHSEIGGYKEKPEDIKGYLIYGLEIFEEFIRICKKNNLTNDFIPTLVIYLNCGRKKFYSIGRKKLLDYKLESLDSLIEDMSKYTIPPEICLNKKIWNTYTTDYYLFRYQQNIKKEFANVFNRQFPNEYKIYYRAESHESKYSDNGIMSTRTIYIQYNENNSETVTNVKRINFKR